MKCSVCGYDASILAFGKIHVPDGYIVEDHGRDHFENGDSFTTLYACPKCGTLQINVLVEKEHVKFSGCKCPWCGNTHPDEFAIHKEERMQGLPGQYTNFRMTCSCGASGPDADSEKEAIEKYRRLKNATE
jgi:ssDNA-binding Zn-finger/Zn-ribbon topoisomerase 1